MNGSIEAKTEMQVQIHMEKLEPKDHRTVKMVIGEPQKEEAQKDEKMGIEENISEVAKVMEEYMDGDIQVGIVMCSLYSTVKNKEDRVVKQVIDDMIECEGRWHCRDEL